VYDNYLPNLQITPSWYNGATIYDRFIIKDLPGGLYPDVDGGQQPVIFKASPSGPETVWRFKGLEGQELEIYFENNLTTLEHLRWDDETEDVIEIADELDFRPPAGTTMTFQRISGRWRETSRTVTTQPFFTSSIVDGRLQVDSVGRVDKYEINVSYLSGIEGGYEGQRILLCFTGDTVISAGLCKDNDLSICSEDGNSISVNERAFVELVKKGGYWYPTKQVF
jgi:hypothetical protein